MVAKRASKNTTRALDVELTPHLIAKAEKKRGEYKNDLIKFSEECLYVLDRDAPPEQGLFIPLKFSPSQLYVHNTIEKIEAFNLSIAKRKRAEGLDVPLTKMPVGTVGLKARKVMWTTYFTARRFWKNEFIEGHQSLVMAHNAKTSEFIAGMERIFHERWQEKVPNERTDISRCSDTLVEWTHHSRTMIKTAGSKGEGAAKGTTLHYLHFSEIASYEDGSVEMANATEAAAKYREEHLESTSNGINMFTDQWEHAIWLADAVQRFKRGEDMPNGWNNKFRLFWAWWQDNGYRIPLLKYQREEVARTLTEAENELIEKFKLDYEQLAWRRAKIANECKQQRDRSPEDHFKMHYPSDPDEAWVGKGTNVFNQAKVRNLKHHSDIIYKAIERGTKSGGMPFFVGNLIEDSRKPSGFRMVRCNDPKGSNLVVFDPPKPRHSYLSAADPAEGKEESDDSVCSVGDRTNGFLLKEAATYASKCDPIVLARVAVFLSRWYNDAFLIGERNKDGIAMLKEVLDLDYHNIYHHKDPEVVSNTAGTNYSFTAGFLTGPRTKRLAVSTLANMIDEDAFYAFHRDGLDQLRMMRRDENGNPCAPEGKLDDIAVVWSLLAFGMLPDVAPPIFSKFKKDAMNEEEWQKYLAMTGEQQQNYHIKKRVEDIIKAARKKNKADVSKASRAQRVLDGLDDD